MIKDFRKPAGYVTESLTGLVQSNINEDRDLLEKVNTIFVAEKSDEIIGVIIAGHDGRRGFIYHTAVNPDYRNQGIAAKLVDAAMDALKANGINKVALVVFDRNEVGNAFWEKVGFTAREDLVYRNKAIAELVRIDT